MTTKDDGGRAFPAQDNNGHNFGGMTLRDWFAGQALIAVMQVCGADHMRDGEKIQDMFARRAYQAADSMLAERSK